MNNVSQQSSTHLKSMDIYMCAYNETYIYIFPSCVLNNITYKIDQQVI